MSDEPQIMLGVEFLVSRMPSRRVYDARPAFGFRVRLAQRELEYSMNTDEFEIPPMECRARRSRAVFKISTAFTRHAGALRLPRRI